MGLSGFTMKNRMKSEIFINGNKLKSDYPEFNGGERNVLVPESFLIKEYYEQGLSGMVLVEGVPEFCEIHALIFNSNALMDLLLVCDAIKRMGIKYIDLTIPYIPYARQDRVCNYGEAHSLKVFSSLINSIEARKVTVYDPHSDVCEALINNINIIEQYHPLLSNNITDYEVIISPDGGAIKKAFKLAMKNNSKFESASKFRNTETGNIENVIFTPSESIDGKNCLIVDDLADAGGSFYHLGKKIREDCSPKNLSLYVTHGLFVNGTDELYNIFDDIYTLDYTLPEVAKIIRLD